MKPLYKLTFEQAKRDGEIDIFRESLRENIRCRDFIDNEVAEKFDGMHFPDECAENVIKEFGYDRTMWVIANTILERTGDGRFHNKNVDWAKSLSIPQSSRNYEFALRSHSCIVDGLAGQIRSIYEKMEQIQSQQEQEEQETAPEETFNLNM